MVSMNKARNFRLRLDCSRHCSAAFHNAAKILAIHSAFGFKVATS